MRRFRRLRRYRRRIGYRSRRTYRRRYGLRRRRRAAARKTRTWRSKGIYRTAFKKFNKSIMPDVAYAVCTYKTGNVINFSSAASKISNLDLTLSCNDPFDPRTAIGNESAQGFDFFRDYYRNYICVRSKIIVHFQSVEGGPFFAYVLPQTGPNTAGILTTSSQQYVMNLPYIKYRKVMPPGASNQTVKIVNTWSISKDTGAPNRGSVWEQSSYSALTNASPAFNRQWYLFLSSFTDSESGATPGLRYQATVVYFVKFYGRKLSPEVEDPE